MYARWLTGCWNAEDPPCQCTELRKGDCLPLPELQQTVLITVIQREARSPVLLHLVLQVNISAAVISPFCEVESWSFLILAVVSGRCGRCE